MEHLTPSRTQQLLTSLRESIVDKPPYISGTLKLPESCFSLFYKLSKDDSDDAARHINFVNATPEKLEQLAQACEPASFGPKQECVLDETYRNAGKMDSECFSSTLDLYHTDLLNIIRGYLLEGTQSTNNLKTELYKLNVYIKGSFFKPHVDTPRSDKMFGSLVIVFPSPHEGGALLLRHRGQEWTFDSGETLAAAKYQPSIGYVAFFSDIEHEVTPVTSGHRITLTYNLYFDDGGPVSSNDAVSEHLISPRLPNQVHFRDAFAALLGNPEFLADGGTLAFGLRLVYPIKGDLNHVYKILKGSDAVVYQSVLALGYESVLYVYYDKRGVMIDKLVDFSAWMDAFCSSEGPEMIEDVVHMEGGVLVHPEGAPIGWDDISEGVEWVTPVTEFNRQKDAVTIGYAGDDPVMDWAYGDVCLVVRVGKAGDRLAYPTVAQMERAYEESERRVRLIDRHN
ncbi:hypothetical protein F5888DRAFT_701539 [Russula emetica]|nr:hypothetical protein F5888DRAFT_701539 [Russula emetica]